MPDCTCDLAGHKCGSGGSTDFQVTGNKGEGGGLYACCPVPHYKKAVLVWQKSGKTAKAGY